MKTVFKVLSLLTSALLILSCGGKKSVNQEPDYASTLTAADTAAAFALSDAFLTKIVSGEIDAALATVGEIDWEEGMFNPLSKDHALSMKGQYETMGIKRFERLRSEFNSASENIIYYRVFFGASPEIATTMAFNAITVDGNWYLAMKE